MSRPPDDRVTVRPPRPQDTSVLIDGRDDESRRFLGEGSLDPRPTFCIVVRDEVVGWVDFDTDRTWLQPGEVNIGYNVFPSHRGHGYATRGVQLLLEHLGRATDHTIATLLIDPRNERSLALARRLGCERRPDLDGNPYFAITIPR